MRRMKTAAKHTAMSDFFTSFLYSNVDWSILLFPRRDLNKKETMVCPDPYFRIITTKLYMR